MTNPASSGNTLSEQSSLSDQPGQGSGWLDEAPSNFRMGLMRRIRIALITLASIGMAALLWWQLTEPFQHTNAHLLLVSGERGVIDTTAPSEMSAENDLLIGESERISPAADFVAEDILAFQPLREMFSLRPKSRTSIASGDLRELLDLRRLQTTVNEMSSHLSDVLMVYLATRTRVDDGEAFLELNVRREFLNAGETRLSEFLRILSRSDASVKLLIIDAGRFEREPSNGTALNEFPHLLEHAVKKTNDPNLWVLCSNRSLEHSHVSRALERSVFGWFVVLGLKGAADFNHDRSVDLDELTRYVSKQVSEFVRQTTGGTETQIPTLLWGGGDLTPRKSLPTLVPVAKTVDSSVANDDPEQWVQSMRQQSLSASVLSVSNGPVTFTPRTDLTSVSSRVNSRLSSIVPSNLQIRGLGTLSTNTPTSEALTTKGRPAADQSAKSTSSTAASTAPAGSDSDPAASPDAASSDPKTLEKKSPFESKDAIELAKLFTEAWELRDELEIGREGGFNPSISAPEEWRRLVDRLLLQERLFRAARVCNLFQVSQTVKTIRDGLRTLVREENLVFKPGQDEHSSELIRQIRDRMLNHPINGLRPLSFGMAELLTRQTGRPTRPELETMIAEWDALIEQESESAFQEWLAKQTPKPADFVEMRLARLLAGEKDLSWTAKQLALKTCRHAEKTASFSLDCAAWIGADFEEAERLRKTGERTLLDRLGRDRESEGLKWLRQASAKYDRTAENLSEIQFAEQLCDRLTLRLPQYVRWFNESCRATGCTPQSTAIQRLADDLTQLISRLDRPVPSQLNEIQNLSMRLNASQVKIEEELDPARVGGRTLGTFLPGDQLPIEAVLNTTLPTGAVRLRLLQKLLEIDRRNVAQLELPLAFPKLSPGDSYMPVDWEWPARTLELELTVPQLAASLAPSLQVAFAALESRFKDFQDEALRSDDRLTTHEISDSLWKKYQTLSGDLKRFYQNWIGQLVADVKAVNISSNSTTSSTQRMMLRRARRGLQLLGSRSVAPDEIASPTSLLEQADAAGILSWHATRFERFRSGAPQHEAIELTQLIQACRTQASLVTQQPSAQRTEMPKMTWQGADILSLESVSGRSIELQLNWSGVPRTPAWVTVHYDPEVIDVKVDSDIPISLYGKTSFINPVPLTERPPTLLVSPDRPTLLQFTVRNRERATGTTHLIVYAVTSDGTARKDLSILLPARPSIDLAVDGVAGSWTEQDGKLRLHPFANRSTSYTLSLINREPQPRELSLQWHALTEPNRIEIPRAELSAVDLGKLLDLLGPMKTLVDVPEILFSSDDKPVKIPFPKPKDAPPAAEDAPIPSLAPHGLLLVTTDRKTSRSLIKFVQIAPQRPRRFLRPQVRYNADRERIEMTMVPVDRSLIPPDGVKVHAELSEPLPDDAARELDSEVMAPRFEARMFVEVTSQPEKVVTLRLNVDGYPRAFTFRVPCQGNTGDLAEVLDGMAVSITAPKAYSAYQSPLDDLPVELQMDVPEGSFQVPGDALDVGIDRNNDRDFRDEPVLTLKSDRQVQTTRIQFSPEGQLNLFTRVGDFQIRVPASGVRSANVQLLGRLNISDRTVWSRPVPVIFDAALPRIRRVSISPAGPIVIGGPIKLTVSASDNDLSGIARIEAAFDTERTGQIPATAKLIHADLNSDDNWVAMVPSAELKPGQHALLVRAVDRVGNVGDVTKVKLTAITAEDAAKLSAAPVSITGVVFFADQVVPGIVMSAVSADGPKIEPAETDDSGQFRLKGLVPGKWKVQAKGVVRNKTRTTELEIVIKPAEAPQPLKFTLK